MNAYSAIKMILLIVLQPNVVQKSLLVKMKEQFREIQVQDVHVYARQAIRELIVRIWHHALMDP